MRLSYLRYALKTATDPRKLLQQDSEHLQLSPEFRSLLEPFVPKTANHVSTEPSRRERLPGRLVPESSR